jgi:hypothetical protein
MTGAERDPEREELQVARAGHLDANRHACRLSAHSHCATREGSAPSEQRYRRSSGKHGTAFSGMRDALYAIPHNGRQDYFGSMTANPPCGKPRMWRSYIVA